MTSNAREAMRKRQHLHKNRSADEQMMRRAKGTRCRGCCDGSGQHDKGATTQGEAGVTVRGAPSIRVAHANLIHQVKRTTKKMTAGGRWQGEQRSRSAAGRRRAAALRRTRNGNARLDMMGGPRQGSAENREGAQALRARGRDNKEKGSGAWKRQADVEAKPWKGGEQRLKARNRLASGRKGKAGSGKKRETVATKWQQQAEGPQKRDGRE